MKKFLLNASSGIGDIMFFLPAVLALKETYPDSQIGFLFRGDETTKETVSSILSIAHNKIDDLQYYNNSNFIHNFKVLLQLKLQKYEYGMILKYDGQSKSVWAALILKLVGCKTIALDGYVKENQYIDNIVPVAKRENIHNVDRCFECLKYFGINSEYNENIYYRRIFNKEKIEKTYTQLNLGLSNEEFIVLCVGANKVSFKINGKYKSNDVKNWPIENWIVLANSLNKENIRVVLVGGKNDIKKIIDCKERLDNSILNLVGRMNIAESISILEYAKIILFNFFNMNTFSSCLNESNSLYSNTLPTLPIKLIVYIIFIVAKKKLPAKYIFEIFILYSLTLLLLVFLKKNRETKVININMHEDANITSKVSLDISLPQ